MHKSASSMTTSVGSQPPTARKSARRKNMAWSPNSSRTPRTKSCGRNSSGAYQVLTPVMEAGPPTDPIRPAEKGGEAGQGGPRIREHPAHHGNRVVGQQGVGVQHA